MAISLGSAEFTVRDGYVGVVRGFKLVPNATYTYAQNGHLTEQPATLDFFVNGVAVPSMTSLQITIDPQQIYPCFFIAERNAVIKVQITYDWQGALAQDTLNVKTLLFGNFILSTGAPAKFDVGNKAEQPISPGGVPQYSLAQAQQPQQPKALQQPVRHVEPGARVPVRQQPERSITRQPQQHLISKQEARAKAMQGKNQQSRNAPAPQQRNSVRLRRTDAPQRGPRGFNPR